MSLPLLLTPDVWWLWLPDVQHALAALAAFLILDLVLGVLLRTGLAEAMRQIHALVAWVIQSPTTNAEGYTKPRPGSARDYIERGIEAFLPWNVAIVFGVFAWYCTVATILLILDRI